MKPRHPLVIFAFAIALVVGVVIYMRTQKQTDPVACTLEAKLCPDGTAVGRVGPDCEFVPCPGE